MIDDIEDDYPEYLEDERGYAWDAWDTQPANVLRRHEALVRSSEAELSTIDPGGLDDFDRWGYARASRRLNDPDGFLAAARLILASTEDHPALQYAEIFIAAIEAMTAAELLDEAKLHLSAFVSRWPEDTRTVRLNALLDARAPGELSADSIVASAGSDAERVYEIAEDLAQLKPELSDELLTRAEEMAQANGDAPLLLDIALFRERAAATE